MSKKSWNWESAHRGNKCGHAYCTECKTKRGNNRGNRLARYGVKRLLKKVTTDDE